MTQILSEIFTDPFTLAVLIITLLALGGGSFTLRVLEEQDRRGIAPRRSSKH